MREQIYDRGYQPLRKEVFHDFALLAQAIGSAFRVLTRTRFEAPWRGPEPDGCDPV